MHRDISYKLRSLRFPIKEALGTESFSTARAMETPYARKFYRSKTQVQKAYLLGQGTDEEEPSNDGNDTKTRLSSKFQIQLA